MQKEKKVIYYGGDYNPDQWDEKTIEEDMRLFKKAGINLLTLPVFSWAKLEPREGEYHFEWLDKILDTIANNGISICLSTPTVAQPAWLSKKYPEVLPVDVAGRKRTHGMRVFFCINSPKYRERAAAIAEYMAKRYKAHKGLVMWHVANEYGTYCYCPTCQAKFRKWLKERYHTIQKLNDRWHTSFWGRTVYDFEEIMLPTELNDDYRFNPTIQLDYMRFMTDSTIECFLNEYNILKQYTPDIPVTTNISGFIKKLDQFKMVENMDVVGWDNYPSPKDDKSFVAFKHDIMRGLKGGQSYMMMEQSPNQQNWQPYNKVKRPGEVRLISYQALAHGADSCLYFQMRQSIAGQEKFHGAVISHAGHGDTRVFKECTQIGSELQKIGDSFLGGRIHSEVGFLFDWDNWWALELSSGPSKDINYLQQVAKYYKAFYDKNIPVDILRVDADLEQYKVVVAPMLYMMKEGVASKLEDFVKNGGTLICTYLTGLVDENDRCIFGEYPGQLKDVLGVWVEEIDALYPEESNTMLIQSENAMPKTNYSCSFLCDIIHSRGALTLATYGEDFYQGMSCVTLNHFGKGKAYYIGTEPEEAFLQDFVEILCREQKIEASYQASKNVEVTTRVSKQGSIVFVINHNQQEATIELGKDVFRNLVTDEIVSGSCRIPKREVWVLKKTFVDYK